MRRWLEVSAVLALVGVPSAMSAQEVGASFVVLASTHEPLGSPLSGGGIVLRTRGGDSSFALTIRGTSLRGHADRFGVPCGGFYRPTADCAAQPLWDDGRALEGSIGTALHVVRSPRVRLSVIGDVALAKYHVETRRATGGEALVADKVLMGVHLGGEGAWYPSTRVPLGVEVSLTSGAFRPVVNVQVSDGYEPFMGGLTARRIDVGVVWRAP